MGKKPVKKLTLKEKKALKMKDVDLVGIKKKINQEILTVIPEDNSIRRIYQKDNYNERYSRYITEEFNSKCIDLIVTFIHTSVSLTNHLYLRTNSNLHKLLIKIVKDLLMNEIEIALYSLYIDFLDWVRDGYDFSVHLFFIGLHTKQNTNTAITSILNHFQKCHYLFFYSYNGWKDRIEDRRFTLDEVNERFRQLSRPYNTYCKKNYIDYNSVVDRIIQLSQPYGEECQGGLIEVKEHTPQKRPKKKDNLNIVTVPKKSSNSAKAFSLLNKKSGSIEHFSQEIFENSDSSKDEDLDFEQLDAEKSFSDLKMNAENEKRMLSLYQMGSHPSFRYDENNGLELDISRRPTSFRYGELEMFNGNSMNFDLSINRRGTTKY